MRSTIVLLGVSGAAASLSCASLVGFPDVPDVGDASTSGSGYEAGGGNPGLGDGGDSGVSPGGGDSGPEAGSSPVHCDGGPTVIACGSACVDVASSRENCRACGHNCGEGSSCIMGVCQPVMLYSGPLDGFGVDDSGIYFTPGTGNIVSCPLTGCALTPTVVASASSVLVVGGDLSFTVSTGYSHPIDYIVTCPETGCTSSNEVMNYWSDQVVSSSGLVTSPNYLFWGQHNPAGDFVYGCSPLADGGCSAVSNYPAAGTPVAASDEFVYFTANLNDAGTQLYSCPSSLTGCNPTPMNLDPEGTFFGFQSDLYVLPIPSGPTNTLKKCPSTGCGPSGPMAVMAMPNGAPYVLDQSGAYWPVGSTIQACPLSGCPAGTPIVTGQTSPQWLAVSGGFLYWAAVDTSTSDAGVVNSIWRVAEPSP